MRFFSTRPQLMGWAVAGGIFGFCLQQLYSGPFSKAIHGTSTSPVLFLKNIIGVDSGLLPGIAYGILTILCYPVAYAWVLRPFFKTYWIVPSSCLGLASWFFICGIVAPLGGSPFMLNWGPVAMSLLIGHLLMGLGVGVLAERGFVALQEPVHL